MEVTEPRELDKSSDHQEVIVPVLADSPIHYGGIARSGASPGNLRYARIPQRHRHCPRVLVPCCRHRSRTRNRFSR